jgi:hypothetical protein
LWDRFARQNQGLLFRAHSHSGLPKAIIALQQNLTRAGQSTHE